jgi:hypothetical protein
MRLVRALVAAGMALTAMPCFADAVVEFIDEANLPFNLSPSNFENSSSNFNNSIANFDNSSANFNNSKANFENSTANFENSRSGERRLLLEGQGRLTYAGYYVPNEDGVVNFFSTSGERMFYNPSGTRAVFDAKKGRFAGVFVKLNGQLTLVLTSQGERVLFLSE